MASNKQKRRATGNYEVGYCRPPAQHRFRPGQSGNPTGQRGSQVRTIADELNATKITIRDGEKTRKVSLPVANLLVHAMKGAKGDARSSELFFKHAEKMGVLGSEISDDNRDAPANQVRPSEVLLKNVDPDLLSREEQVELSKLASVIDSAGDIFALSTSALDRVRELVNKGRSNVIHFPRQTAS
jgi:Family of unknown function (DUF5681)